VGEYRIFISHKDEDKETAIAVKTALSQFDGDLKFFISGESIPAGDDWKSVLRNELRQSDLLLLLFTEPTRKWDWCLYEVGLFTTLDEKKDEPVVCMYNPEHGPPGPLTAIQGVPATVRDVSRFIERLVKTTEITGGEEPFNDNVTDESIKRAATAICDHFVGNIEPYYACHRLYLEMPGHVDSWSGDCEGIPPECEVQGSEASMRVFGRLAGPTTWATLVQAHVDAEAGWLAELDKVFCDASAGLVTARTTRTFRGHDGGRIFRPELYRIDRMSDRPVAAVVMLTEEIAPAKVGGSLFNRLRIAERYKKEVFDYRKTVGEPLTEGVVAQLVEGFDLISEEAITLNIFEDKALSESLPSDASRAELTTIVAKWNSASDELHNAHRAQDSNKVGLALESLEVLNNLYRATVARSYSQRLNTQEAAGPALAPGDRQERQS
jgi:hypothetical protein